jgi:hypothetical protein
MVKEYSEKATQDADRRFRYREKCKASTVLKQAGGVRSINNGCLQTEMARERSLSPSSMAAAEYVSDQETTNRYTGVTSVNNHNLANSILVANGSEQVGTSADPHIRLSNVVRDRMQIRKLELQGRVLKTDEKNFKDSLRKSTHEIYTSYRRKRVSW